MNETGTRRRFPVLFMPPICGNGLGIPAAAARIYSISAGLARIFAAT
jgi:hypothetical protein